jgi:hypothetical protein
VGNWLALWSILVWLKKERWGAGILRMKVKMVVVVGLKFGVASSC